MAEATVSDTFAQVRGFKVEITGAGSGSDVDSAWETVSSGQTEATVGSETFHTTTPGHKYIDEITLRGAMTDKRAALCTWINDTVTGKPWKRTVVITPDYDDGTGRKRYEYHDCFPTRYVFPGLHVLDPNDLGCDVELVEEVAFTYASVSVEPAR